MEPLTASENRRAALREFLIALALAIALVAVLQGGALWGATALIGGDARNYFLPRLHAWVRDGFAWYPWSFGGQPYAADPQSLAYYPPAWLLRLGGAERIASSLAILEIWHHVLAGLGMFLLARRFASRDGALVAMVAWLAGSFYTGRLPSGMLVFTLAGAWLPWHFLATAILAEGRWRARAVGGLALIGGMQLLAGMPQLVFITWFGGGAFLLARHVIERHRPLDIAKGLACYGGGALIAVMLASPHLLLISELVSLAGERTLDDPWAFITGDSLQPRHLLTWLWPEFFAPGNSLDHWSGNTGYHEITGYLTVPMLLLASGSIASALRRDQAGSYPAALLLVGALGMGLAFGANSPLFRLCYEVLPGFDLFRVPARWAILFGVSAALSAAVGFDHLAKWDVKLSRGHLIASVALAVVGAAMLVLITPVLDALGLSERLAGAPPPIAQELRESLSRAASAAIEWQLGLLVGLAMTVFLLWRRRAASQHLLVAIALFTIADASRYWRPFRETYPLKDEMQFIEGSEQFHRLPPAGMALERLYLDAPVRERLSALYEQSGARFLHTDDAQGWKFEQFQHELLYEGPAVGRIESLRGYQQLLLKSFVREVQPTTRFHPEISRAAPFLKIPTIDDRTALDAYNVRWIVTYHEFQTPEEFVALGFRPVERLNEFGLSLYENPNARGAAWVSPSDDWLVPPPDMALGKVSVDRGTDMQNIEVWLSSFAVLHISSSDYPGWQWKNLPSGAEVLTSRSIRLPPGHHKIRREFHPNDGGFPLRVLALTWWLGALSLLLLGASSRDRFNESSGSMA